MRGELIDSVAHIVNAVVQVHPHMGDPLSHTGDVLGQGHTFENGQIANGDVFGLIENLRDTGEEFIHRGAQVRIAKLVDDSFQLGIGSFGNLGPGSIAGGPAKAFLEE